MVLGIRSKGKKGSSIQVEYLICIQEIKPWPPSQSLKMLRSVLLQWDNGEQHSGCIKTISPSNGSGFNGKIEFNESFKLSVTLSHELSAKGVELETFQKNLLELNLYEPRRDKTIKGQLLGTVVVDLAEYGIIKNPVNITTTMNCKRNFRNTSQPVLSMKIQPYEWESGGSLSKGSLSGRVSSDNGKDSVSALMNEEYAEEAQIASFTDDDDDAFSHSSQTLVTNSSLYSEENADSLSLKSDGSGGLTKLEEHAVEDVRGVQGNSTDMAEANSLVEKLPIKYEEYPVVKGHETIDLDGLIISEKKCLSQFSSTETLTRENPENIGSPQIKKNITTISDILLALQTQSSSTSCNASLDTDVRVDTRTRCLQKTREENVHWNDNYVSSCISEEVKTHDSTECAPNPTNETLLRDWSILPGKTNTIAGVLGVTEQSEERIVKNTVEKGETVQTSSEGKSVTEDGTKNGAENNGSLKKNEEGYTNDCYDEAISDFVDPWKGPEVNVKSTHLSLKFVDVHMPAEQELKVIQGNDERQVTSSIDSQACYKGIFKTKVNNILGDRLMPKNKSVRSMLDSSGSIKQRNINLHVQDRKELANAHKISNGTKNDQISPKLEASEVIVNGRGGGSTQGSRIQELQVKIDNLETELREAATVEVALYSVVAEHGGSVQKVHTPARRLSRMYMHAYNNWSVEKSASAARSIVSALVLVAKACGNDVPRLMYWLSNSVVLRTILSQGLCDLSPQNQQESHINSYNDGKRVLKWKESSSEKRRRASYVSQLLGECQDHYTFSSALEKIESWIFNRVVESIWWQTLTSYMHYPTEDGNTQSNPIRKASALRHNLSGNFSIQLWKKAFREAFERICPVRACGHKCGCLPVLAKQVMEQCIARLDVAMFNGILRESADEIPTDPVSDPISGSRVLPIPCGNFCFGAGAQLKNAVGNWSRWLSDLFDMDDDDDFSEDEDSHVNHRRKATSLKPFHLLNALSDLLMLPKDMLMNLSIRKKVCPALATPIIRRIMSSFTPDEFCPDRVSDVVLRSLDSEITLDQPPTSIESDVINIYPINAAPIKYSPPPPLSLVSSAIGELREGTSKFSLKCPTSDDELDELHNPLYSIVGKSSASPAPVAITDQNIQDDGKVTGRGNVMRYQLLREVWLDVD